MIFFFVLTTSDTNYGKVQLYNLSSRHRTAEPEVTVNRRKLVKTPRSLRSVRARGFFKLTVDLWRKQSDITSFLCIKNVFVENVVESVTSVKNV